MLTDNMLKIFRRELAKLRNEIDAYKSEAAIWATDKEILNSGGNLCLHICGNLSHFVGAALGNTGYVRDRDLEFLATGVPRAELLEKIDQAVAAVERGFENLTDEKLADDYPVAKHDEISSVQWMLLHLIAHLNYHLGQVNYHRRLLDSL